MRIINEARLVLMTTVIELALKICPDQCTETIKWFGSMPFEELD